MTSDSCFIESKMTLEDVFTRAKIMIMQKSQVHTEGLIKNSVHSFLRFRFELFDKVHL